MRREIGLAAAGVLIAAAGVACDGAATRVSRPSTAPLPDPYSATTAAGAVACPTPLAPHTGPSEGTGDYGEFVYFNGTLYRGPGTFSNALRQVVEPTRMGAEYARVSVKLGMSPPTVGYAIRSCDASYQEAGIAFYRVDGYDPEFLLARSDGVLYHAAAQIHAQTAADLFDIRTRVKTIEVDWYEGQTLRTSTVADGFQVEQLVDAWLRSPIERTEAGPAGQLSGVTFVMEDGLRLEREYRGAGGNFEGQIVPSHEFEMALRAAAGIPPP